MTVFIALINGYIQAFLDVFLPFCSSPPLPFAFFCGLVFLWFSACIFKRLLRRS